MKKTWIVALLFFVSYNICGQDSLWSLEECIKYAYDNNIRLKQYEILAQVSENNFQQAKDERIWDILAMVNEHFGDEMSDLLDEDFDTLLKELAE